MKGITQVKLLEIVSKTNKIRPIQLVRRLHITPQALHRHLNRLCKQGVLEKIGRPPATCYQCTQKPAHGTPKHILTPSQMRIISELHTILSAHPAILLVTLFGSVARGDAGSQSDIDLMVWLSPTEAFDRRSIWGYWDRQARHLSWANKVSIITARLKTPLYIHTLLLDLPEEHLVVFDRKNYFELLKKAIVKWRIHNGAFPIKTYGGTHAWKYSTKASRLDEIDFTLEIKDVP